MATQTTYYEFNKPEGTDLVNPLVDTNPNWDALDADLHEFNERSISNASEIVSLGVHTISRLDTTAKFLKWIATANFTAGDTFTVDGLPVAATTPAGASLATNAYVTGSVVLACLNADNSAMTIFVSGTNVATDSERLGGELPSFYGKASDVSDNASDITNLQNQVGNTSIVGIGDGTCTGAIDTLNTDLSGKLSGTFTSNEEKVGTWFGKDLYRKCYSYDGSVGTVTIDPSINSTNSELITCYGAMKYSSGYGFLGYIYYDGGGFVGFAVSFNNTGVGITKGSNSNNAAGYRLIIYYTKNN